MNPYYKGEVENQTIEFVFSTAHRRSLYEVSQIRYKYRLIPEDKLECQSAPKEHLVENQKYLIFLSAHRYKFDGLNREGLPALYDTLLGTECFKVENSSIIDKVHYFDDADTISVEYAKSYLKSALDQIASWR